MRKKKHLIAISKIAKLLSFAMAFLAVFLVAAFSNSNKANAQTEQVGVDFEVAEITADMLTGGEKVLTVSDLPGFVAKTEAKVEKWNCIASGLTILIYSFESNKTWFAMYINGKYDSVGTFEEDAGATPTHNNLISFLQMDYNLYYPVEASGGPKHTHADGIKFEAWTATDSLPTVAGNYCLTQDVNLSSNWNVSIGTTNLCLNGYSINFNNNACSIYLYENRILNLYDCNGSNSTNGGQIKNSKESAIVVDEGTFNMYSGTITNNSAKEGGAVRLEFLGGTFVMYGGTLSNNSAEYGGAIYNEAGSVTIKGGIISNNTAESGGGIYNTNDLIIESGQICNNTAKYNGGVYSYDGVTTIKGGSITNNTADIAGGIFISLNAELHFSGAPVIKDNLDDKGNPSNVLISNQQDAIIIDAALTNEEPIGIGKENYTNPIFTGTNGKNYKDKFTADSPSHDVEVDATGALKFVEAHSHDNVKFTEWTSNNSLPSVAGSYYLTQNVSLTSDWTAPQGITNLCLNGYDINLSGRISLRVVSGVTLNIYDCNGSDSAEGGHIQGSSIQAIEVREGKLNLYGGTICDNETGVSVIFNATFIMYGGSIVDNQASEIGSAGGGVSADKSTFIMNGGTIAYNEAYAGGGVYLSGHTNFIMNGGSISHNTASIGGGIDSSNGEGSSTINAGLITQNEASDVGGGIYIGCEFTINGGSITDNYSDEGGAIYNEWSAVLHISGAPVIKDNLNSLGEPSTIYIYIDESDGRIIIDSPLTNTTPYGVRMNKPGTFTYDDTADYKNNFTSEDPKYAVKITASNALTLAPAHDHNLSYTASGATITATCSAEGCSLTNKQATLTLVAPTELAYDGTAKVATFENGYNKDVFANPVIKYYKGTEEVTSCINAGTYVAKVTYGEATAQVSFTITTVSMADYTLTLSANTLTYSGVEQTVVTTVRLGDGPILTEGTDYTVSGNVATNVGEYTVTVTGKDNFEGELTATFNIVAANIRGVSVNAPEGGFDDNYFYVVTTWEKTGIFAWTGNGAYFGEWPGTEMTAVGNGMFKIAYPEFKSGDTTIYFIFNDATGERVGHQTADLKYSKHAALSSLYYVDANCVVTFDPRYQNCAEIILLRNSADIDSVVFAELNLVEETDYTVVYKSLTGTTIDKPVLPGSYIISITGKGNFEGTVTKEFTLVHEHDLSCTASGDTITATCSAIGCPLTDGTATLTIKAPTSLVYDGNAKSALLSQYDATVFNPGTIKYYKGDEEVAAEDVKNAGIYVAKVTSNELTIEVTFEITAASLDGYTLTLSADTLTYNAEEQTVITTVRKTDGPILTEDKDYTVSGNKGTNAGEYTVTVTAKGNYAGTLTATFTIEPANIQGTSVDAPEGGFDDNYFYVVTPWAKTNIYAWTDASGEYFGNWPGTEMTSVGNGMFKIAYPALKGNDTSIKFIFNNNTGSKQTSDLGYSKTEALGSVYYVTDGGATTYTTTYKPRYQNSVVITVSEDTGNVESITFGTNVLVLDVDYTITYKDSTGNPITKPTVAGNYTSVITGIGNYTGTVEKALTITHIHNFTYVANGNKITASCGADCPITTGLEVIMEAPANLVYDGDTKKIGFTTGYSSEVFQGLVIKYYKGTEEVECKNAGTYVCKATIGGVTAQLEFTIAKAESNPVAQDYDTYYGKKLSEIILDEGWAWDNPNEYVGNVGDHYYSATYTPEDTENYKTKTMELLVTVVIAIPDYTAPTGLKVLINKTLADVTLPAGFSWKNATQNVGDEVGEKTFKATYTPEDTENYEIVENIDVTVLVYDHEHNLSYTASGATITATCSAEGCPLDNKQATLTLVAPANLVYDGTAKAATFANGYDQNVFASPVIKYYKGTEEVTSCINAGDYVAKVTYGNATAQVSFTIAKAESNPVAQDYDTYYGKKLSEIILDEGWAWDNPDEYVGNVGDHYYSATYTPEDTENYKTKTMELLVTVVIAIPDYTLPTGLKVLINKTLADVTLPAGFSWKNATQNVGDEVGEKIFKATYTPEDTENYEIVENIDVTVLVYAHEHSFTYKANGSKITAKCNNEACYITEGLELKLLAPTGNMVYDGNARVATLEEGYDEEAFPTPVIKYYKGTEEVTSCVDAGDYVAKVTYGNATAQVSFTIETWNIKDPKGVEATIEGAPYTDNITIVVEVKTSLSEQQVQADYDKIKNKLEANEDISKVYEVKLIRTVDGVSTEIQPADIKPGTEITIVMTLPEEVIKAGSFRILHIHNADDVEFITNFVVKGKSVSFKVSRLSEFAFILKSTPENHGFCIGWVLFIIMILQIMYLCFFCLLPVFNKKGKLVGKMDLFELIGIGTAIAALFFAVIVLAVHACTIAVVSSILSTFICIAYIVIMIIGMVRIPANK